MRNTINIMKALADENRVRIVLALARGELCVCQITEMLELAPSTVSKHLSILKNAGLIKYRKDGRWIHYQLDESSKIPEVGSFLEWIIESLKDSEEVLNDFEKLKTIEKKSLSCVPNNKEER
ncbi:MAG: winged helix-turn-helix transcriptional regulator [Acidobacteria bacterium]|nr:winged helix-turn-helix transcriptional regulator [Acidobacteriota bacterium]